MWPTVDGYRILVDEEARWMRHVVHWMLDRLVSESRDITEQDETGVALFDQWDCRQRIWLLEQTVIPMLTPLDAPDAAAVLEATIEALFAQTIQRIEEELTVPEFNRSDPSWRSLAWTLITSQGRRDTITLEEEDVQSWHRALFRKMTELFGPASYWKAESHRDGDFQKTAKFLHGRGLPNDFLARIPPLRTAEATQASVDRLQSILSQD